MTHYYPQYPHPPYPVRQPENGIGTAAMVVGIIAAALLWMPIFGMVLGLIAVPLAAVGMQRASQGRATNKGMAIAGLVTGLVGLLPGGLITIAVFAA